MGAVRGVCLSDLEKLRSVNGVPSGVCLLIRFGEIEINEWVPSDEFVCSSDLGKLRSVNGCRQRSLFVHQIWRN